MLHTKPAVVVLATTIVMSGCGGTTATSPQKSLAADATAPLTRATLIAKADAICARVNAKRATVTITSTQSYAQLTPLAAYERTASAELATLAPPASMADDWHQILNDSRVLAEVTDRVAPYAQANNLKGAHTLLVVASNAEHQMLLLAKRDGFSSCARLS